MLRVLASRTIQSLVLLLLVSVVAFALLRLTPGDPGALLYGPNASPQELAQVRERWGLDGPLALQYLRWLGNAASGDLGRSYADGRPVLAVIGERMPATLLLAGSALMLATLLGVVGGTVAATHLHSLADRLITLGATALYSIPSFWLGLLLIAIFSLHLGWLPSGGMRDSLGPTSCSDMLRHLLLPALALGLRDAGRFARVCRASVLEELGQQYVQTAAAKGLGTVAISTRHVLRNALLPFLTLLGMSLPGLLGGSVVVETVFAWPGMGRLAIESALQRNYPVIMGEVLIVAALALLGNLLADLSYGLADPRARYG